MIYWTVHLRQVITGSLEVVLGQEADTEEDLQKAQAVIIRTDQAGLRLIHLRGKEAGLGLVLMM